jgi:hypothetical protein
MDWSDLAQDRDQWRAFVNTVVKSQIRNKCTGYSHMKKEKFIYFRRYLFVIN